MRKSAKKLQAELNEFAMIEKINKLARQIVSLSKNSTVSPTDIANKAGNYATYLMEKKKGK